MNGLDFKQLFGFGKGFVFGDGFGIGVATLGGFELFAGKLKFLLLKIKPFGLSLAVVDFSGHFDQAFWLHQVPGQGGFAAEGNKRVGQRRPGRPFTSAKAESSKAGFNQGGCDGNPLHPLRIEELPRMERRFYWVPRLYFFLEPHQNGVIPFQ